MQLILFAVKYQDNIYQVKSCNIQCTAHLATSLYLIIILHLFLSLTHSIIYYLTLLFALNYQDNIYQVKSCNI